MDPLDGTRPYIRGIPTFSVLIALEDCERLVLGCMHLPGLSGQEGNNQPQNDRKRAML